MQSILQEVSANDAAGRPATATTGGYKLVISVSEPNKLASPTMTNIQGSLCADWKCLGMVTRTVIPHAGLDVYDVGAEIFWWLRDFERPTLISHGCILMCVLQWLRNFDQRLRESMEYALCLNSLGSSSDRMWMHVSKPPENAFIKQILYFLRLKMWHRTWTRLWHKKINISNSRVAWEHEQFSRQRITAVTLSQLEEAPFLGKNAPIITALHKELAQHTKDASLQHETVDSTFVFYDLTKAQLTVYQVASVTFDFIVALVVGSYLILLFIILFISTKGVDDFIGCSGRRHRENTNHLSRLLQRFIRPGR